MTGMRAWFSQLSKPVLITLVVVALLIVGVAFVGIAKATDQPVFCRSCHEMTPYHDAWSQGPHNEVSCIECHVDSGDVARLAHKFVALKEVVAHVKGDTLFPRETPPEVPDQRCLTCHAKVTVEQARFDHALHAKRGACAKCHAAVGHDVTVAALKEAGIYSGLVPATASVDASTLAVVNGGQANLTGHVTVTCSRCHIMANTTCAACHKPKHKPRGACATCHAPGPKFVFVHPKNRPDCETCHKLPAKHTTLPGKCSDCHKKTGVAWSFQHPSKSATCTNCHKRPAKHKAGACTSCHRVGTSWAFKHPSSSNCSSCHKVPSNHFGSNCASCHSPGRSWSSASIRHPGIPGGEHSYRSFPCVNCHPSGFSSATCRKCHDSASGPRDD